MKRSGAPIKAYSRRPEENTEKKDDQPNADPRESQSQPPATNTESKNEDASLERAKPSIKKAPGSPTLEDFAGLDELTDSMASAIAENVSAEKRKSDQLEELEELSKECRNVLANNVKEEDPARFRELPRSEILHLVLRTVQQTLILLKRKVSC